MPELPDLAAFGHYLQSTALHQRIAATRVLEPDMLGTVSPALLARRLKRRRLTGVSRTGKYLFVRSDGGGWLVLHFGMTGELKYHKPARRDDLHRHCRLALDFRNGYRLEYRCPRKLGRIDYAEDREAFEREEGLGPDALDEALDRARFVELLSGHGGTVKAALMNQSLLAGIGNVFADEILFQAGIRPDRKLEGIDEEALRALYPVLRRVLRRAARLRVRGERWPGDWLLPRRGKEQPRCPACRHRLRPMRVSGRKTWFCPSCQH